MHAVALVAFLALPAQTHPVGETDPKRCVAVVEEMGKVGLRISDAQAVASDAVHALRKRMGYDRVVFEGTLKGQEQLKRMLGAGAENQMQEEQIAYFRAAIKHAPYKVRVRFGTKKGKSWISVSCRKSEHKPRKKHFIEEKTFTAAKFGDARKQLQDALPEFCKVMDPPDAPASAQPGARPGPGGTDTSGPLPPPKKKENKPWTPPPRRD
jgi:hypothetical protein